MMLYLRKRNIKEKNARILALFLFQYSFLIPLMMFFSSTMLVAISGIILLTIILILNIDRKAVLLPVSIFFAMFIVVFLKLLIYRDSLTTLITYISICFPAAIVSLYEINCDEFIDFVGKLSVVNFFVICWYPFVRIDYMRFGYGILLSCMGLYIYLFEKGHIRDKGVKSKLYMVLLILSCLELVLYGARGAAFSFGLLVVLDYLVIRKKFKRILFLGLVFVIGILNFERVLYFLEGITARIGIGSRAIAKYRLLIDGGAKNDIFSGRLDIYSRSLNQFKAHPLLGGSINFVDQEYSHNIFLDAMKDFGIVGLLILVCILVNIVIHMATKRNDNNIKIIYGLLFALAIGRLMFSSTIWLRPEFWVLLFFCFGQEHGKIKFRIKNNYSNNCF